MLHYCIMWKAKEPLKMIEEQKETLQKWVKAGTTPQRIVLRSRVCLLAAEGKSNNAIASALKTSRPTVLLWRSRFEEKDIEGLTMNAPHGPSTKRLSDKKVRKIVEMTLHSTPLDATHWSTRTLGKKVGVSHSSVARVWDAHGLQPHRIRTFKVSKDKQFVEKLTDVVGLYLNPPDKALVLCVDEKSQVQALDRTQPGLPMKKGRCGTMTHDYKRNGTTCLFAALNMLDGTVIGACYQRHRSKEFLKFLRKIDRDTPKELALHLIADNYGTHKHPTVQAWLQKHTRFHMHFTPTSSSWLNMIERWFAEITRKRIRRGVFKSVPELVEAIMEFIKVNNENPKPLVWTKKVEVILKKVNHCKAVMETLH